MKKMWIIILVAIFLTSCNSTASIKELEKKPVNSIEPNNEMPSQKVTKERFAYKGSDNEVSINYEMHLVDYGNFNGFKTIQYGDENLEWIILDEVDDKLLLLAKNVIDVNFYDEEDVEYLYTDANGNLLIEMYTELLLYFSMGQFDKEYISKVKFDNGRTIFNEEDGVYYFSLSENELKKYFGDVNNDGINKYYAATCSDIGNSLYHCSGNGWYKDNVPYYLRDDTDSGKFKKWVGTYGKIYNSDENIENFHRIGIRPAMYVNKSEALKYLSEYYLNEEKMTNTIVHVLGMNYGTDASGMICRNSICVSDNADFYLTDYFGRIRTDESTNLTEMTFDNDTKCQVFLYDQGKVSGLLGDTLIMNCDMDNNGGIYDKYTQMVRPYVNGRFLHVWKNAFNKIGGKIENFYHIKKDDNIYKIDDYGYLTDDDGEIITVPIATSGYISFKVKDEYTNKILEKKRYYLNNEKFYCGTTKKIEGAYKYFDEKGFLITNDIYKYKYSWGVKYSFINDNGIAATQSETKIVNGRIFDVDYINRMNTDCFYRHYNKFYYRNSDGTRAINKKIADKWFSDKNGVVENINDDNYYNCNRYIKYYNMMYPGDKEKAFNMRSKLLDILKQPNIYKKAKTQNILDDLENKNQDEKPTDISNYDIEVDKKDENFYKNVWKINDEIIRNSVIYTSNNIYGTDENGMILKNGFCVGKDGLTYLTNEEGEIVLNKSYGMPVNGLKYYFENKGNVFTGKELILEELGLKITFNQDHTIEDVSNIYEIINDSVNGNRCIKEFPNNKNDFIVIGMYKGYQIDDTGFIVEKEDSGYYEFDGKKRFYRKTDKGGYYCVNSEYGSNIVFDENGYILQNGFYQHGKFLYLTDENGLKISADKSDPVMRVDGNNDFGRRIDLEKGTVYVGSNGIINSRFIFIKSNNTYDIYYAKDDGYIAKNCWLTDRLHFDEDGKLETENVTENNVEAYEKWIKFYEIMN